eukprot:gnl/MRDRNA2_/MRDRNA2_92536_c0_seq1.p1 gnl/MRDRNA2_/MRDRNA2_92536_c0~~gnl/MRDRNA2_/MRDRNA2_92536_c0_seq1.p1  ORF type:complete len:284 (+),score=67.83 gnl/MRDRNA2_/MRDRNA2_92536_c0_seq1:88-939(+)
MSVTLAEPLFQEGATNNDRGSRKVLLFSLMAGLGFVMLCSQLPSTDPAIQDPTISMPLKLARSPSVFKPMQPAKSWNSNWMKPWRSVQTHATFPATDVEIDSKGVSFPITAVCEVGELGKACDGSETDKGVCGQVTFTQKDEETIEVKYKITGLPAGKHGFHIHEKADFSNGCASAGPHYNPFKAVHGGPDDLHPNRHVGDLGNIEAGADGVAEGTMTDKYIKIFGEYTVVGRSMMVHADPDDLGQGPLEGWPEVPPPPAPGQHTKTTGNAGARIGCGVINIQ